MNFILELEREHYKALAIFQSILGLKELRNTRAHVHLHQVKEKKGTTLL